MSMSTTLSIAKYTMAKVVHCKRKCAGLICRVAMCYFCSVPDISGRPVAKWLNEELLEVADSHVQCKSSNLGNGA